MSESDLYDYLIAPFLMIYGVGMGAWFLSMFMDRRKQFGKLPKKIFKQISAFTLIFSIFHFAIGLGLIYYYYIY